MDIEHLNELERENPKEFIEKIKQVSNEQKAKEEDRAKKFDSLFSEISKTEQLLKDKHTELEKKHQEIRETKILLMSKSENDDAEKAKLRNEILLQKQIRLKEMNQQRVEKRDEFIESSLYKWRRRGWVEFGIGILIMIGLLWWLLYSADWSIQKANDAYKAEKENIFVILILFLANAIFTYWVIKSLVDKYRNHSNIKAYVERLKIPDEYKEVKEIDELT